jgi:hypothetical protein
LTRWLQRILPEWTEPAAEQDERMLNEVVDKKVGPIGFSPIAEAYHNFDRGGVAVVLFFFGVVLGMLDRLATSLRRQALAGVCMFPFIYHVRNAFVPLPAQLLLGVAIVLALGWLAEIGGRATRRWRGGAPRRRTE